MAEINGTYGISRSWDRASWYTSIVKPSRCTILKLYAFFWVIPRHLNFICRRFGTLCQFHLHRQIGVEWRWNRHSVPKRRHIKFRRRGITQKKKYNIQNTAKVWNKKSSILLNTTLHALDGLSVHHQEFKTAHTQHQVYAIQVRWLLASGHKMELVPSSVHLIEDYASAWFYYRNGP